MHIFHIVPFIRSTLWKTKEIFLYYSASLYIIIRILHKGLLLRIASLSVFVGKEHSNSHGLVFGRSNTWLALTS